MHLRKLEKEIADKELAIRKIKDDMKKNKLDQYSRQEHWSRVRGLSQWGVFPFLPVNIIACKKRQTV